MINITLNEYDKNFKYIELNNTEEVNKLYIDIQQKSESWKQSLGLRELPFLLKIDTKRLGIKARGVTGFISINNITIEIKPKFLSASKDERWKIALLKTLFLLEDDYDSDPDLTSTSQSKFLLFDLLAMVFINSIKKSYNFGFPREYIEVEDHSSFLKGRYDFNRVVEHLTNPIGIPCIYDEYTLDNQFNSILVYVADLLSKSVISESIAYELKVFIKYMNIPIKKPSLIRVEQLVVHKKYYYIEDAVYVSKLLLRNIGLESGYDTTNITGVIWSTYELFERLVKFVVKKICRKYNYIFSDKSYRMLEANSLKTFEIDKSISTTPDIQVLLNGHTRYIMDAKYKVLKSSPKNSDIYQVITGAMIKECPVAGLVYPSHSYKESVPIYDILGQGNPTSLFILYLNWNDVAEERGIELITDKFEKDLKEVSQISYSNL